MPSHAAVGRLLPVCAIVFAAVAVVLAVSAGPGTRFGLWSFRLGLGLWLVALIGGLAALVLGLIAIFVGASRGLPVASILLGLAAAAAPLAFILKARSVPPIHDITTDLDQPPAFEAVLAERGSGSNPAAHPGAEVAARQRAAYPDVLPAVLPVPPAAAFDRALAAARELEWSIASADPARGRIEATDTTPWFGFKDDVVIRVRAEGAGSRVDVRSKSRVGRSDVGANAARIRRLLARLQGS
jgi:hypothetical protein